MHQIVVVAMPVFALFIAVEWAYGRAVGRNTYRLNDAISNLSQGLLSQLVAVCTPLLQIGLYTIAYQHLALFRDAPLWQSAWGWLPAVLLFDFCDYWLHRVSHESALFWAAHVVHHQSECLNLSTALRQESAYPLLGWMFYLPMAVLGVPPQTYALAGLVVLLYQFWIHTEHVGKLGWFDRVFSSPSNHRVHHAVNDRYIDKNYGALLVVWDRLFGTFAEESEPCVYGTRTPLASWNPLWAVAQVYASLSRDVRRVEGWRNKLRVLLKAPGWQPGTHATLERIGTPPDGRVPYDPPMSAMQSAMAAFLFLVVVPACAFFLWRAEALTDTDRLMAAASATVGLWLVGALLAGRMRGAQAAACGLGCIAVLFVAIGVRP